LATFSPVSKPASNSALFETPIGFSEIFFRNNLVHVEDFDAKRAING